MGEGEMLVFQLLQMPVSGWVCELRVCVCY